MFWGVSCFTGELTSCGGLRGPLTSLDHVCVCPSTSLRHGDGEWSSGFAAHLHLHLHTHTRIHTNTGIISDHPKPSVTVKGWREGARGFPPMQNAETIVFAPNENPYRECVGLKEMGSALSECVCWTLAELCVSVCSPVRLFAHTSSNTSHLTLLTEFLSGYNVVKDVTLCNPLLLLSLGIFFFNTYYYGAHLLSKLHHWPFTYVCCIPIWTRYRSWYTSLQRIRGFLNSPSSQGYSSD